MIPTIRCLLKDALHHTRPKFLYIIPAFSNPSGVTMSHSDREKLVRLSAQYSFKIIADEVGEVGFLNLIERSISFFTSEVKALRRQY